MQCPYCGSSALKVLDTTDTKSGIRRRRECSNCEQRFTTYERPLSTTPVLIKSDGNREEFDREKLKRGIWNACAKRPIPAAEIDKLANHVEATLQSMGRPEVSSRVVGDTVVAGLKDLDPIAYIRYAIVYLGLDNLLSVRTEIDKLLAEQQAGRILGSDGGASKNEHHPEFTADQEDHPLKLEVDKPPSAAHKARSVAPKVTSASLAGLSPGSCTPNL
ncbi:MAG: transcriptional regulator NrdR [Anaerolineae bacterium]|nr:transcriptional regulator NrdR [Anaerolineae bacterium]